MSYSATQLDIDQSQHIVSDGLWLCPVNYSDCGGPLLQRGGLSASLLDSWVGTGS